MEKRKRIAELLPGQVREGVVRNITDYGAFVDLGACTGLLHISNMSWKRAGHPSNVVAVGAKLDVKVLDIDWTRKRLSLGLKQLLPHPWRGAAERYPAGARVRGKVARVAKHGAFLEVEDGMEGLIRAFEMSWTRDLGHPSERLSAGDEIEAVVLGVDEEKKRLFLGLKQMEEDPWLALPRKYPPGTRLSGTVQNLMQYGAFVEIEPGVEGLVHLSELSWTKQVEHPSRLLCTGSKIDVHVLDIDSARRRIQLSIKRLADDPWADLAPRFPPGTVLDATALGVCQSGMYLDLGNDVERFLAADATGVEAGTLDGCFRVGQRVPVRVVRFDVEERCIDLEIAAGPGRPEARVGEDEIGPDADPGGDRPSNARDPTPDDDGRHGRERLMT